jgi:hypothetical protein
MDAWDRANRKMPDECLPCFALQRSPTWIEPHASLRLQASAPTLTGLREDYNCGTCGRRMVRFLAQQTNPVPSDVWRFERDAVTDRPESADSTQHAVTELGFENDSDIGSPDECASVPNVVPDTSSALGAPHQ